MILFSCFLHCVCCNILDKNIIKICDNFFLVNEWFNILFREDEKAV